MDVYFGRNFWHGGEGIEEGAKPGDYVKCGEGFWYGGFWWFVPGVYVCREGIVADICRRVPREAVSRFSALWGKWDGREEEMTPMQQVQAQQENPFHFEADFHLETEWGAYNGSSGSSICIRPGRTGEEGSLEARIAAEYGLNREDGWQVFRYSFRCREREGFFEEPGGAMAAAHRENDLCSLPAGGILPDLMLEVAAREVRIPCGCSFTTEKGCGKSVQNFVHPVTGQQVELTILGCREYAINSGDPVLQGHLEGYRLPGYGCVLEYVVKPRPALGESLVISDCSGGDRPIFLSSAKDCGKAAVSVGIIGGADGPSSVFLAGKMKEEDRDRSYGYSSLYFEPVAQIRWKAELRKAFFPPKTVRLKAGGCEG